MMECEPQEPLVIDRVTTCHTFDSPDAISLAREFCALFGTVDDVPLIVKWFATAYFRGEFDGYRRGYTDAIAQLQRPEEG